MNEKQKIHLLKCLMWGYSNIVVNESKEHTEKEWYKHADNIHKHFTKHRPKAPNASDVKMIQNKVVELIDLDTEYFKNKNFSAYICMFDILEYLMYEIRDIEIRSKFLHFPMKRIREELYEVDGIKEVSKDTDRYITRVLENIGVE